MIEGIPYLKAELKVKTQMTIKTIAMLFFETTYRSKWDQTSAIRSDPMPDSINLFKTVTTCVEGYAFTDKHVRFFRNGTFYTYSSGIYVADPYLTLVSMLKIENIKDGHSVFKPNLQWWKNWLVSNIQSFKPGIIIKVHFYSTILLSDDYSLWLGTVWGIFLQTR